MKTHSCPNYFCRRGGACHHENHEETGFLLLTAFKEEPQKDFQGQEFFWDPMYHKIFGMPVGH